MAKKIYSYILNLFLTLRQAFFTFVIFLSEVLIPFLLVFFTFSSENTGSYRGIILL